MRVINDPSDPVYFSVANPAANNEAEIYIGVEATLDITITNNTGAALGLQDGDANTASTIELFMPGYFTVAQKAAMTITDISQAGWAFKYDKPYNGLMLVFGNATGSWANGATLSFTINTVTATAQPTIGAIAINLDNITGTNVPATLPTQNLALNASAPVQAPDLADVLQLGLDNQGLVFVSTAKDPLSNTIYLNIKNALNTDLYNDPKNPWTGNPTVTVSFIYGTTAGALAPADGTGEAWMITASTVTDQGWGYTNPKNTGQGSVPVWTLYPQSNNQPILGTGADANVTFAFNNINSFTPAGHTQMMVTFNGFMMNKTTAYASATFVIDIAKQNPPPTRGIQSFTSIQNTIIPIQQPTANIPIALRWSMFYVDNIKLFCNVPGVGTLVRDYFQKDHTPNIQPVAYDGYTLVLPVSFTQDTPVFITLQAFDNNNNYLNALQFTVFISASFFVDPGGNRYPTVFLNNQTWLAGNYQFTKGGVSYGPQAQFGLLYKESDALNNVPDGWRLPTQADWNGLISSLGAGAFTALMANGTSQFNALAGGMGDSQENFSDLNQDGYYWSSTPDNAQSGNYFFTLFDVTGQSVVTINSIKSDNYLSVRYVKNT